MEFDPKNVNQYSIDELMGFYDSGVATFTDFQRCGLRWDKQKEVQDQINERIAKEQQEENAWLSARENDTIQAYKFYLGTYGENAKHAFDAKLRIQQLIEGQQKIYVDLFRDMHENMMDYKANVMNVLFGKVPPTEEMCQENSPIGRFLKAKLELTFEDLYRSGILPEGNRALEKAIFKDDFEVPQLSIEELGEVPTDRTDVYFLGIPASGKSCVLAGFLNHLHYAGEMQYLPTKNNRGIDGCRPYYNALIKGLSEYKAPRSTGTDTVSFMQLNLGPKRDRAVTAMELSGEAFKNLSDANCTGQEVWEKLGVGRCLKNNNPKTLFFLLDYSSIIGKNPRFSAADQEEILGNALDVFSSDGTGRYGEKNCTMSKVKTVAIVITKSDLMDIEEDRPLTQEERADIAVRHLQERFRTFMNNLSDLCHKYDINSNNKGHTNEPFITTFSLGHFFLGNSVIFDKTDSKRIADFVVAATERNRRGLLDFLQL